MIRTVMKYYKLIPILLLLLVASCKKFSALQGDPNSSTTATPGLLLTNVEEQAFNQVTANSALASRMLVNSLGASDYEYYSWQRGSFNNYNNMRQVIKMNQVAGTEGKKQYQALAKFFNSFFIVELTQQFGSVPYSDALNAANGNVKPKYDSQEAIYAKVLKDLSDANSILMSNPGTIKGDIIYNGNPIEWRKLINSFTLRVLISLSHKTGDAKLNVKQRFQTIISDPQKYPIMTSNSDNGELKFVDKNGNRYPYYNDNAIEANEYMAKTFVDKLKNLKDPRLFAFADRAPKYSSAPADSFGAYNGVQASATLNKINNVTNTGTISRINARYYSNPTTEPSIALGYSETEFNISEAILRGWISGNANTYYQNGIRASMKFYGVSDAKINAYISQDSVKLSNGNSLHHVLMQKYLSFFMNSGWEAFYNQRRTGYPVFDVSGGGVADKAGVPKRWMYPESELQNNTANVNAAIKSQFPNKGDDINATMWLLKN